MGKGGQFSHRQRCPECVQSQADCLLPSCPASHPAVHQVDFSQEELASVEQDKSAGRRNSQAYFAC